MIKNRDRIVTQSFAKINLGLNVKRLRTDGYHDIDSLLYPLSSLFDLVEIIPSQRFGFSSSGLEINCPTEKNLCIKAFRLMQSKFDIGEVSIHLHKQIPTEAGLGGGSSNAASIIRACDYLWELKQSDDRLRDLAIKIGSDVPFFINPQSQIAKGRGEILTPHAVPELQGRWIAIIKPKLSISTTLAYQGVSPIIAKPSIEEALALPIEEWRGLLKNDFEDSLFKLYPTLGEIKESLYKQGAIYASMSGAGSAIYGIFTEKPSLFRVASDLFQHIEQL